MNLLQHSVLFFRDLKICILFIRCEKKTIIMPVPKKNCPVVNCDFRPIALNSNIMKSFERLVVNVFEEVKLSLGPFQFA